ncbi:MAG TPA: 2-oxo acid dehydrogenase subunit E2 [Chthonomonadaceae bacterium]|nr:2-oxo acid dehydrogenase subunit E2 [Chthonomonadaceae bacterium]
MATVDIKVPQMGEGLTEVRLIEILKAPGDHVARDEVIYTMETDKATLEVESPEAGILQEWHAAEGDVLPIGAVIATISDAPADTPSATIAAAPAAPARAAAPGRVIPPRTRAYARELGLDDETLAKVPSATAKLMPSDLDAYVRGKPATAAGAGAEDEDVGAAQPHQDRPLPDTQRKLNFHLRRSAQIVAPGTIHRPLQWGHMREFVARARQEPTANRPTEFQSFAYCAVQAAKVCPKFRSALLREDTVRQFDRLNLGVAVGLPNGELTTAVVPEADLLPFPQFIAALQERIRSAREGADQADASVQLLLTYLGSHGVRDAVPVLVVPAAAVIFLGEAYESEGRVLSNVSMTFDHRLLNGVEAAEMLAQIALQIDTLD